MTNKLIPLVLMIVLFMGMSVVSEAATITVGSATGGPGTQVSIPIDIDSTAGRLDCSFSVSFDKNKLEYVGKTAGNMNASLLTASLSDINATGKVQPIVMFEEGGATSGTITSFKFNIKTGAPSGKTPLNIGNITPAGTYQGVSGSITIIQCSVTISPTSQTFSADGGTGSVNIIAPSSSSCTWNATSNSSWIIFTSESSGTGNGTVNYSVSENGCTSERTGTITIAEKTFTVTQEGNLQSTSPTISVGTVTACNAGTQIEVPVSISDTGGRLDCSFSISFDKAKLQYTGKTSGDMGASVLVATIVDINADGMVQPIVQFEEGGATSGTICKFRFTLRSALSEDTQIELILSDISPPNAYCGESGAVRCSAECSKWSDVIAKYNTYMSGQGSWKDVIVCYNQYIAP